MTPGPAAPTLLDLALHPLVTADTLVCTLAGMLAAGRALLRDPVNLAGAWLLGALAGLAVVRDPARLLVLWYAPLAVAAAVAAVTALAPRLPAWSGHAAVAATAAGFAMALPVGTATGIAGLLAPGLAALGLVLAGGRALARLPRIAIAVRVAAAWIAAAAAMTLALFAVR